MMIKKDFQYRILTYILMLVAILLPWVYDAKYNQDLLVLVVYLKTVFEESTFISSFNDNVTIIYVARSIFPNVSPHTLVYLLHNISVLLLTFTLTKYLKPIYVCAVMLFCFFTILCNQFRLSYSLALGILGFMNSFTNKKKGLILLVLSLFFHFFVAFFIFAIWLLDSYNKGNKFRKILILFWIVGFSFFFILFVTSNPRFALYLQSDESGFVSSTFLPVSLAIFLIWKSIDKEKKLFVSLILILTLVTAPLPNISSRMGEMLFIMVLFLSKDSLQKQWDYLWDAKVISKGHRFLYFFIGLLFFTYRFVNWVILDKLIRPEILDHL